MLVLVILQNILILLSITIIKNWGSENQPPTEDLLLSSPEGDDVLKEAWEEVWEPRKASIPEGAPLLLPLLADGSEEELGVGADNWG